VIVTTERVAHGGWCVAHADDGRVVFVRHALPGERVRIAVTEERAKYLRADAVEVIEASPQRVAPPCPWAGPGRCGGCDWQHAELAEQRRLKAAVVVEQLQRLAGIDRRVVVEPVPGDDDGLGWRTRMRFAVDASGRAGLMRHRSHHVEPIDDCLIAHPSMDVADIVQRSWQPGVEVTADVSSTGERAVAIGAPDARITEHAAGRDWSVPVGGFWQVHRGAADVLAATVLELAAVKPDDVTFDLYSGVGLFAGVLAPHVARAVSVESDQRASRAAAENLAASAEVVTARVDRWIAQAGRADIVVLDPPRKGAGADVVRRIVDCSPRTVIYVACDPASLARDVGTFASGGYELTELRAFDLFPMTAHVECVAKLDRAP
jgi:tRNA/tmRNA/rRNA uracil-C5-methylase (TrmA/RlmC/RlmD family)